MKKEVQDNDPGLGERVGKWLLKDMQSLEQEITEFHRTWFVNCPLQNYLGACFVKDTCTKKTCRKKWKNICMTWNSQ